MRSVIEKVRAFHVKEFLLFLRHGALRFLRQYSALEQLHHRTRPFGNSSVKVSVSESEQADVHNYVNLPTKKRSKRKQ